MWGRWSGSFIALMLVPCVVHAALEVPVGYRRIAAEYAIPPQIFYAVALTESGKQIESLAELRPWPWTLNIAGTPYFFAHRDTAERALIRALQSGEAMIDIGVMQVNWRYHGATLRSPRRALEPYHNLRVAAQILNECYRARADWWLAVGCYHAPGNAVHAARYQARVHQHWQRVHAVDAS